jgi:Family of unknown function (DUF5989)
VAGIFIEMAFLFELWAFLRLRKKLWLLPLLLILLISGSLVVLAEISVFGPLIYTLF